jgi:hypothetical protein
MPEEPDGFRVEKAGGLIFPPWEKLEVRDGRAYTTVYVPMEISWPVKEEEEKS